MTKRKTAKTRVNRERIGGESTDLGKEGRKRKQDTIRAIKRKGEKEQQEAS